MAEDYLAYLDRMADEYGVPREQVRAIYQRETASGRNVRPSSAGAQGHMQLMPGTAREMGVTNINDPYQNIRGGVRYYAQQLRRFRDPALAAAAYNAGPGRVRQAGMRVPRIPETQQYVASFLRDIGRTSPSPAAPASATVAPAIQGTPNMPQPMGGLNAAANPQGPQEMPVDDLNAQREALYRELAAMPEQDAQRYKTRFEEGQRRINEMYSGPSSSQSLLALSRALLSPRRYKGFGGTMYNVTQALEGIGQQREAADLKRAEALARLQESYDENMSGTRSAALNARLKLLEMQGEQQAAEAKARQPKVQYDAERGVWVTQPGTGGAPQVNPRGQYVVSTAEEAAMVPAGAPFVYSGDPSKIYYGRR